MKKYLIFLLPALALAAVSCEGGDNNPPAGDNTIELTEDISYPISHSVKGTDGLTRYFNATLSLARPDYLSINHNIADTGSVEGLTDITDIPTQGWSYQQTCTAGHGYVLRISSNDGHGANPGTGTMYVRVYVTKAVRTSAGVVTSAKILVDKAWKFEGFTPEEPEEPQNPDPGPGSGQYAWTRKANMDAIVTNAYPEMFVVGSNLYLMNGNYAQLWQYNTVSDKWTLKTGLSYPSPSDSGFQNQHILFRYVYNGAIYVWIGFEKKIAGSISLFDKYLYCYSIVHYDEATNKWIVDKNDLIYNEEPVPGPAPDLSELFNLEDNKAIVIDDHIYAGDYHVIKISDLSITSDRRGPGMPGKSTLTGGKLYSSSGGRITETDFATNTRLSKLTVEGMTASVDMVFGIGSYVYVRDNPNMKQLTIKYDPATNSYEDITADIGWPHNKKEVLASAVANGKLYTLFNETELWVMSLK